MQPMRPQQSSFANALFSIGSDLERYGQARAEQEEARARSYQEKLMEYALRHQLEMDKIDALVRADAERANAAKQREDELGQRYLSALEGPPGSENSIMASILARNPATSDQVAKALREHQVNLRMRNIPENDWQGLNRAFMAAKGTPPISVQGDQVINQFTENVRPSNIGLAREESERAEAVQRRAAAGKESAHAQLYRAQTEKEKSGAEQDQVKLGEISSLIRAAEEGVKNAVGAAQARIAKNPMAITMSPEEIERQIYDDPNVVSAIKRRDNLLSRADAMLDSKAPKPPRKEPKPLPKSKSDLVAGEWYITSKGIAVWDGNKFRIPAR